MHGAVALAGMFRSLVIGSKLLDLFTRALQHGQMRHVQLDFSCVPNWNHTDDNMHAILSVLDRSSLEQLMLTRCRHSQQQAACADGLLGVRPTVAGLTSW